MSVVLCLSKTSTANSIANKLTSYNPCIASTQTDFFEFLKIAPKPTIILLELSIYKNDLTKLIDYLENLYPNEIKILGLTNRYSDEDFIKFKDMGISACVSLHCDAKILQDGINALYEGRTWKMENPNTHISSISKSLSIIKRKMKRKPKNPSLFISLLPSKKEKSLPNPASYISLKDIFKRKKRVLRINPYIAKFRRNFKDYEIKKTPLEKSLIIKDIVNNKGGSSLLYDGTKALRFTDISIPFISFFEEEEKHHFCFDEKTIKCINDKILQKYTQKKYWQQVSINVENYLEKEDYLSFDTNIIPKNISYSYSVGDGKLKIQFKGKSKVKEYKKILNTFVYSNINDFHKNQTKHLHVEIDDEKPIHVDILVLQSETL